MSTQTAHVGITGRSARASRRRLVNIAFIVAVVALAAVWAVTLRPQALGGPASYVLVRGQSMEPTYHSGDLVLVRAAPSYEVGDIVAFRVPDDDLGAGIILIHRIIGGSASEGYQLKGDNNDSPDAWLPRDTDVVGKAWIEVPRLGSLLALVRDPLMLASLAAGIAAAMVLRPSSKKVEQGLDRHD